MARGPSTYLWGARDSTGTPVFMAVTPVSALIVPYTRTRWRVGPPSSRYTGTPKHLPVMSHRAWSMPERIAVLIGPPR